METVDDADSGGKRTDYNFQFAKRFWNNRFRIVVGGKVSTTDRALFLDERGDEIPDSDYSAEDF